MEDASEKRPPVVVAGAFQTGVVLMRDLQRHGIRTFCIDCNGTKQGFRTIYGKAFLCPDPDETPAAWAAFMIDLAGTIGARPVLIPSSDMFVSAIAEHAATLEPYYILRPGSAATQALLATKKRQYEIADGNGLAVPRTAIVGTIQDLHRFAAEARFPCLMKPLHFREWQRFDSEHPLVNQKIALADTPAALEALYVSAEAITPTVVLQEIIEGPDTAKMVYLSCYGKHGRRLGACLVRELRVAPIYFGSASVTEPIRDPAVEAMCDAFFRSVHYEGLCELELKRDTRDGEVRLIEANPRYSVTADAATYAGVELGWLHYLDMIDEAPTAPMCWNGEAFHHIVLTRDVECFRSYRKAGLTTWWQLIRSYRRARFFDFDWKDRQLSKESAIYVLKELFFPIYRRFLRKNNQ